MFKRNVQKYIDEKGLFTHKDKILVALSGGADSVALFRVLLTLNYSLECAHCNFHLRGEESDRDEKFVRLLCEQHAIHLHVIHFDTENYAKNNHLSIEMAARELRYKWFEQLREQRGISYIAVAHHRDDSVETLLLNLIRGTGINGLKGISPKNGNIVRPLLQESRDSILNYLEAIHQTYVTDSTNLQDEYMRNKIRLNIIPLMKELNPSVSESINETAMRLSEVALIYNKEREITIREKLTKHPENYFSISIRDILTDIAPMSLLHEILSPFGFNSNQIKDIYYCISRSQPGKQFYAPEWRLLRDRDLLIITNIKNEKKIPKLIIQEVEMTSDFEIPRDKHLACLDADKITSPFTIRKWEHGDKFVPLGMKGKKNISDYLTDKKFSIWQKEQQYVVCSGEFIVWLVNERIDNRFQITSQTKHIVILKVEE